MLKKSDIENCTLAKTPRSISIRLDKHETGNDTEVSMYEGLLIGSLYFNLK